MTELHEYDRGCTKADQYCLAREMNDENIPQLDRSQQHTSSKLVGRAIMVSGSVTLRFCTCGTPSVVILLIDEDFE